MSFFFKVFKFNFFRLNYKFINFFQNHIKIYKYINFCQIWNEPKFIQWTRASVLAPSMAEAILSSSVSEVCDVIDSAEGKENPRPGIPPIPTGIPLFPTPDCSPEDGISVTSSSVTKGDWVGDKSMGGKESPGIPDTNEIFVLKNS